MTLTADFVTSKTLTFQRMRALLADLGLIQEGVVGAGDLKVAQRAAGGANMSVDVATGDAWVRVDTGTRNGLSHMFNDAIANAAITAAHATLPRLDQVVLQYNDSSLPAGVGGDVPTLRVIPGTPTSGATLDNRTGAASLPNDALRIADVLVAAAAASIVSADIRDRRPWAAGAFSMMSGSGSGNHLVTSTTPVVVSPFERRIEVSAPMMFMTMNGRASHNVAGGIVYITFLVDGSEAFSAATQLRTLVVSPAVNEWDAFYARGFIANTPAGSKLCQAGMMQTGGGTGTLADVGNDAPRFTIEESVRASAHNT